MRHIRFPTGPLMAAQGRTLPAYVQREFENYLRCGRAEMKDPVKDKLKRFGLFARLGEEMFFPTVGSAVSSYLTTHAVEWDDWEDRRP